MVRVVKRIRIRAPVDRVYAACADVEGFPRWMKAIQAVTCTGDATSLWRARVPGLDLRWESRLTRVDPPRCLAWRAVSGVTMEGRWDLKPTDGETRLTLTLRYEPPLSLLGALVMDIPAVRQRVDRFVGEALQGLKALLEQPEG